MIYAILTPETDTPIGYYAASEAPTPEELADHMARTTGCASRDDWIAQNNIEKIGYAPVH